MASSGKSVLADGISFEVLMWEHSGPLRLPSPKGRCPYRRWERAGLREQSGSVDGRAEAEGHGRPRAPEAEGAGRAPPVVLFGSEALQPLDLVLNGDVPVWCASRSRPARGWVLRRLIQDTNAPREVLAQIPRGDCRRGRPLYWEACEQCCGVTGRAWAVAWARGQAGEGPRHPKGSATRWCTGRPRGVRERRNSAPVRSSLHESHYPTQSAAGERAQRDRFALAGHPADVQGAKAGREAVTAFRKVPLPFSPPADACRGGVTDTLGSGDPGRAATRTLHSHSPATKVQVSLLLVRALENRHRAPQPASHCSPKYRPPVGVRGWGGDCGYPGHKRLW